MTIPPETPPVTEEPPAPPDPAPWGLSGALLLPTLAYAGQIALAGLIWLLCTSLLLLMDPNLIEHPEMLEDLALTVGILPLVMASSLLTLVLLYVSVTVMWGRPLLASLGLRPPEPATVALYTFLGGIVALFYVFVARAFPPAEEQMVGGPMTRLAESGPAGMAMWFILAVLVAPVMEELLFRGYAFLGARRSLGSVGAGAVVTVVFVALHITETGSYLPALAGITSISTVLILVMIRSGNLTYCITCHLGYNATLALLAVLGAE